MARNAPITADVEIDESAFREFITGFDVKEALELIGAAIETRAIPKMGYDSGDLQGNSRAVVLETTDGLVLTFGTGLDGSHDIKHDIHHWAPGKPGGTRAQWKGTRPWSRALGELGIEFESTEGYDV